MALLFNDYRSVGSQPRSANCSPTSLRLRWFSHIVYFVTQCVLVILTMLAYYRFRDMITSEGLQQARHIARKTFQAFRIFVNNEINELNQGIHVAHKYLKSGGKLVSICFHSLEDRVVKSHFSGVNIENPTSEGFGNKYKNASRSFSSEEMSDFMANKWKLITKKAITPTEEEIASNHRSRSAHMRVAVKI